MSSYVLSYTICISWLQPVITCEQLVCHLWIHLGGKHQDPWIPEVTQSRKVQLQMILQLLKTLCIWGNPVDPLQGTLLVAVKLLLVARPTPNVLVQPMLAMEVCTETQADKALLNLLNLSGPRPWETPLMPRTTKLPSKVWRACSSKATRESIIKLFLNLETE